MSDLATGDPVAEDGGFAALNEFITGMDKEAEEPVVPAVKEEDKATPPSNEEELTKPTTEEIAEIAKGFDATKAATAFATQRMSNRKTKSLLENMAKAMGIPDGTKGEELEQALSDKIIAYNSKKQNVPVETLKEIEATKRENITLKGEQLKAVAHQGFQKLIDDYKLNSKQITEFANQLLKDGKNPFTDTVNILDEYRVLHFEDIVKFEVAQSIKNAEALAAKASNQGASGSKKASPSKEGTTKQIDNVADLDSAMAGLKF